MSVTETESVLVVTDAAAAKVAELIAAEGNPELALRVGVRPGGCSGYSYEMYFDSEAGEGDIRQVVNGVGFIVDPASAGLLKGATLDYRDAIQGGGFKIENPNAQRSCGCGSSFS